MLTLRETERLADIQHRTETDVHVFAGEKQWVLNIMRREGVPMPEGTLALAERQGFDVRDMVEA